MKSLILHYLAPCEVIYTGAKSVQREDKTPPFSSGNILLLLCTVVSADAKCRAMENQSWNVLTTFWRSDIGDIGIVVFMTGPFLMPFDYFHLSNTLWCWFLVCMHLKFMESNQDHLEITMQKSKRLQCIWIGGLWYPLRITRFLYWVQ